MMNRFQCCVASAYAEGAYATLANSDTWRRGIDELGDGLFRYLVLELATGENCESWPEAIMRTEICVYELEQVSAALRAAYLQEKSQDGKATAPPLQVSPESCTPGNSAAKPQHR
ncbi:MAG: hypothetical protein K2Q28_10740 [Hyphomicrobium sp.]|nr:hypothetical protein [Hyphomicrobium sp.]